MRIATKSALLFVLWFTTFAQSPVPVRVFEVASIRPHPEPPHSIGISTSGARLTAEASFISELVMYAYDLRSGYQISGERGLYDMRYDIQATAEGEGTPTKAEFREMMRALLADRFKLEVHREMKEQSVYALAIGKGGPKFKESSPDAVFSGNHGVNGREAQVTLVKAPAEEILRTIRDAGLDRPVLDKTGLTGTYDIKLTYTPEFRLNRGAELGDISIFDAVQEQLGLRLESQKAMIEMLVIDNVEKPTGN